MPGDGHKDYPRQSVKSPASSYVIRGGVEGKKRLELLARVLWPGTSRLLEQAGLRAGMTCLDLGSVLVLHLPGEPFVEYQLKAQEMRKDVFVCVAGYGDGGMGYIPTDRGFLEGGYEPTVALAAPCEEMLRRAMAKLLSTP